MIALGKHPGVMYKGAKPLDVYVGGHPVAPGISLDDYPLQEAYGAVITCEPLTGYKLGITSHITAVQEGEGDPSPDNVRPISGWNKVQVTRAGKNLLPYPYTQMAETNANGGRIVVNADGSLTFSGTPTGYMKVLLYVGPIIARGVLYASLIGDTTNAMVTITLRDANNNALIITSSAVDTSEYPTATQMQIDAKRNQNNAEMSGTGYPYLVAGEEKLEVYEPYTSNAYTADLPETVYGGTLDWRTGLLTVTHGHIVLTGEEKIIRSGNADDNYANNRFQINNIAKNASNHTTPCVCTHYPYSKKVYYDSINEVGACVTDRGTLLIRLGTDAEIESNADFAAYLQAQYAAGTPVQVVYKLATPYTIQLTPQQIAALAGGNTIYSDCGDTAVSYRIRTT